MCREFNFDMVDFSLVKKQMILKCSKFQIQVLLILLEEFEEDTSLDKDSSYKVEDYWAFHPFYMMVFLVEFMELLHHKYPQFLQFMRNLDRYL